MTNFVAAAFVLALAGAASAFVLPSDNLSALPYDGCGVTVGCFGLPKSTCVGQKTCDTLLTYAKGKDAGTVQLNLYSNNATLSDGMDHYVSVGINNIAAMNQSTILNCIGKAAGGIVVTTSYAAEHAKPIDIKLPELTASAGTFDGQQLQCQFTIKSTVNTNGQSYDLSKPTYLLVAGGLANPDSTVQYHYEYKSLTPVPVSPAQALI